MMVEIDSGGAGPEPDRPNRATAMGVALSRPWVISIWSADHAGTDHPAESATRKSSQGCSFRTISSWG